jgi:hypothetical protein
MKNVLYFFIGAGFSAFLCFFDSFVCNGSPDPDVIIEKDTIKYTVYEDSLVYVAKIDGKPDKIPDTLIIYRDTLFLTDTVFVYNDYFNKYVYADTLRNDTNAFIFIRDTIYRNKLYNRFADIRIINTNKTEIIPGNDRFVSLGAFYVYNPNVSSIGIKTSLENDKNEFSFGIGTDKIYLFEYSRKFHLKPLNFKSWKKREK